VLGLVGGAVGTLAMGYARQKLAPLLMDQDGDQSHQRSGAQPLDSIAVAGRHHRRGEGPTAALGRMAYEQVADTEPQKGTKSALSSTVHWSYGIMQGGVYGLMRGDAHAPDLEGGLAFGTGLWLLGDELMVPMLGLQKGPTAYPPEQHLHRLLIHLVYGVTTAATTQMLQEIID
jgi:hypothetical protein